MIQPIVLYPDPSLVQRCVEDPPQNELWDLRQDLWDTVCHHGGYGLAAPQIGKRWRAFIFNGNFCVNPIIVKMGGSTSVEEEGCLSLPGIFVIVERPIWIKVRYNSLMEKNIQMKLSGFEARVFQHEFDHLNGVLILDRGKVK